VNVLLVPAHPGFPVQIPQSRKTVVVVVVVVGTGTKYAGLHTWWHCLCYRYDFLFVTSYCHLEYICH